MSNELKPCPFCGSEAHIVNNAVMLPHIACGDGCVETGHSSTVSEAIAFWNDRAEPAVRFQSTPTVEQIEAHAKAWPLPLGDEGGYWREFTENCKPLITRLHVIDGRAVCYCEHSCMWQFFNGNGAEWLPLQPNGVPVGFSVEPATARTRVFAPHYLASLSDAKLQEMLTVYALAGVYRKDEYQDLVDEESRRPEAAAPAVKEPDNAN